MWHYLLTPVSLWFISLAVFAQPKTLPTATEFTSINELSSWKWLHEFEEWPDKVKKREVADGMLVLEPGTSGWFADKNAPFLFKEVSGDFDVRARVKATGLQTNISETIWSLGGLMVRVPKPNGKNQWKPKEENWMFMTTGVAEEPGKQVIETKYTLNSRSNLKLRDAKAEWITLRIVRVGNVFIMLCKYDQDTKWTVHDRFYLADWPQVLQVGINCYTNSSAVPANILWGDPFRFNSETFDGLGKPDFRLTVDFIRFTRPLVNYDDPNPGRHWLNQVYANKLIDYSLDNNTLLMMLGD